MTATPLKYSRADWIMGVAALLVLAISALIMLWPQGPAPPNIQGAILPTPKPLSAFRLTDHQGQPFTHTDLNGDWHLISYGFTHCPDICPTTLFELAEFRRQLEEHGRFTDLQVLFYTIDPIRDTRAKLADYVPWFHDTFIGLRANNQTQADAFQTNLGLTAQVSPSDDPADYDVAHGMRLYLIDSQGRYRASLEPTKDRDGSQYYEPERLLEDYLALRSWSNQLR
ncbi:SCO family protein [Saccharospirillum salsuginis]|uniref:SCO family protein n=1 Tax=Saccharospirillum salsuginis TaxID=418750 RepID=A0A918ND00_9GAMM|nr:SCO family protein [Saccharospirillum salsuginis]GGX58498.1 SCO family protein [Saccharospirillum salsuginis]